MVTENRGAGQMNVVQELEKRREAARAGGGARRVEAQHAKG